MASFEMTGKVIAAMPERSGEGKKGTWVSQEFVIEEVNGKYPSKLVFTVFGADKLQQWNIQIGQVLTVSVDVDAHEWNGRWYNDVRAYNVINPNLQPQAATATPTPSAPDPASTPVMVGGDKLPTKAPETAQAAGEPELPF